MLRKHVVSYGRERGAEWSIPWRERQVWRGEGSEQQADMGGMLATRDHVWVFDSNAATVCVDICDFYFYQRMYRYTGVWANTEGHVDIWRSWCHWGQTDPSALCCHGDFWAQPVAKNHVWAHNSITTGCMLIPIVLVTISRSGQPLGAIWLSEGCPEAGIMSVRVGYTATSGHKVIQTQTTA